MKKFWIFMWYLGVIIDLFLVIISILSWNFVSGVISFLLAILLSKTIDKIPSLRNNYKIKDLRNEISSKKS